MIPFYSTFEVITVPYSRSFHTCQGLFLEQRTYFPFLFFSSFLPFFLLLTFSFLFLSFFFLPANSFYRTTLRNYNHFKLHLIISKESSPSLAFQIFILLSVFNRFNVVCRYNSKNIVIFLSSLPLETKMFYFVSIIYLRGRVRVRKDRLSKKRP